MPAQSKQQQKFMGMVHALKKGEMEPSDASPELKKAAQSMSDKDAKDFASTPHKGLPKKVKQEILNKLKEYAGKMNRDHMGGDSIPSANKGGLRDFDGYDDVKEGMMSTLDQIKKTAKNPTDFIKKVLSDNDFKDMKGDRDFIKYLHSIYEGVSEGNIPTNWLQGRTSDYHTKKGTTPREDYEDTNFDKEDSGQPDLKEKIISPKQSNPNYLAAAILNAYDFATEYIDDGSQKRKAEKYNDDILDWFDSHPSDIKQKAFKIMISKQPSFKSKIQRLFGDLLKESINEAGLKGTENIPSNKKLSQLSDNEKLNIIQSLGNIISFHIPDWAKGRYKFWQVISAGKIKKKKDLDGEIIYFLSGKGPQKASPTYKSVKDLINGVDWDTMELRRESVNEGCWKGYKQVGGKMKNGRMVPNCVPESVNESADTTPLKKIHDAVFKFLKTKKGVGEVKEFSEFPNRYGDNVSTFSVKYNIEDKYNYDLQEIKIEYSTSRVFIPNKGYFSFKTFNDIKNIINKKSSLKESVNEAPFHALNNPRMKKSLNNLVKDKKVQNPETGKDVALQTALSNNDHPAHDRAVSIKQSLLQRLKGMMKNEYGSVATDNFLLPSQEDKLDGTPKPKKAIGESLDFNEREMVVGIIDILKQVDDKENRKRIALNMIKKFKEEGIDFDYQKFLNHLKEYSMGSYEYNENKKPQISEAMFVMMRDIAQDILPKDVFQRAVSPQGREELESIMSDLKNTLNKFFKMHKINKIVK